MHDSEKYLRERTIVSCKARLRVLYAPGHLRKFADFEPVLLSIAEKFPQDSEANGDSVERILDCFLIWQSIAGDTRSFQVLQNKYYHASMCVIMEYSSRYNLRHGWPQSGDDVFQNAWIKIWKHLHRYDAEKGNFYTWIRKVIENLLKTPASKGENLVDYSLDASEEEDEHGSEARDKIEEIPDTLIQNPEQCALELQFSQRILQVLFTDCGFPWQVLCMGFLTLDFTPKEIVADFSDKPLGQLSLLLKKEYLSQSKREAEELDGCFEPLQQKMCVLLRELFTPADIHYAESFQHISHLFVGEIELRSFFGKSPNKNISDWNARVRMRLKNYFQKDDPAEN